MAKRNGRTPRVEEEDNFYTPDVTKMLGHRFRFKCKNEAQKEFSKLITDKEIIIAAGPAGTGKAQPLDAKILTPNGWVTMGDINVGDIIMGRDGKTTNVLATHPQGIKPIYRVTFSDNSSTECCAEHLWFTQTDKDRHNRKQLNGERISSPKDGSVKSLLEIKDSILVRGRTNHNIPLVEPIQFPPQPLVVDPYLMGCLLGDGSITSNNIKITSPDEEIIDNIDTVITEGCYSKKIPSSQYDYAINSVGSKNPILDELREVKLFGCKSLNKFIPDKYLFNDINVRVGVLQGLMDTDGTVDSRKGTSTTFTSISKQLIDGLGFIIRSLGGTYTTSTKMGKYKNKSGELVETNVAYTLHMKLPTNISPFRLSRKTNLVTPKTKYGAMRFISNVEYVGDKEAKCITIDNKDHLYVTDDFIVTHNSFVAIGRAIELLQNVSNPYNNIVISKPSVEAEEKVGFVPGSIREKMEPSIASALDIIDKIIGKANRIKLEEQELIIIQPLGFIRGKTFDNSMIIIEEAQNLSPSQCKTLLSRIGSASKMIISGDLDQSDRYKDVRQSGLFELMTIHRNIPEIGFYEFGLGDIVRNPLITKILKNYPQTAMPQLKKKEPTKPEIRVIPEGSTPKKESTSLDSGSWIKDVQKFFKEKFSW